jgi:hypothetical protein
MRPSMRGFGLRVVFDLPQGRFPERNVKRENVQAMGGRNTGHKFALCQSCGGLERCVAGAGGCSMWGPRPNPTAQQW